jgi:hypothetical protein
MLGQGQGIISKMNDNTYSPMPAGNMGAQGSGI